MGCRYTCDLTLTHRLDDAVRSGLSAWAVNILATLGLSTADNVLVLLVCSARAVTEDVASSRVISWEYNFRERIVI